jgi:hypothetical protein
MSTNKVTENTPVHEHYRSDALIATGATLSVLILGGVLQFLSPNSQKMATESEVSQPMTAYSATASTQDTESDSLEMTTSEATESDSLEMTTSEATESESLEMTTSEVAEPSSETTEEMPLVSEQNSFTSETNTETEAAAPTETEPVSVMEATVSTITDPATINQLNGQVYDTIDKNWTTSPTFTGNLVYQIQVNETGAISSYDSINQAAKDYNNDIPLASLVKSDSNSDKMAKFVVVFTPAGQLEVSPWIAN